MATDHLWRRGHQYYFRMTIPAPLRRHFHFLSSGGKVPRQIIERLSDSHSVAKALAAQRAAACEAVFVRLRTGDVMTPEQVKAALHPEDQLYHFDERVLTALTLGPRILSITPAVGRRAATGETISQALDTWIKQMERDAESRPLTIAGHRDRVRAFVGKVGDVPLTDVTRAMASDFVDGLDVGPRTRKIYRTSLKCLFESARERGRFTGENPFAKKGKRIQGKSYVPFTVPELQTLFNALPRDTAPARHSPETALPWVALIALYTGMRLEEIAQLTTADIRPVPSNGDPITVIDIHNGRTNKLKNETSARLVPVHSALWRAGLLDYVKALPAGPLFPGLKRRESKGGKIGARLGEIFRKRLVALRLKREGLCFHSFRHTVAGRLDAAGVPQSDAARILGHAVAGMSYGTYSQAGPGLKRVAAVVEQITYEGLRL
jgi:integrase